MAITLVSITLAVLMMVPVATRPSEALLIDHVLPANAAGTSSKVASTASSSSIDTVSSLVVASAIGISSSEEAFVAVASSSKVTFATTASSLEIALAASTSISSSSKSSTAALEELVPSLEDDELSKSSYTRRKDNVRMSSLLKN
jgi:hypothetical protein